VTPPLENGVVPYYSRQCGSYVKTVRGRPTLFSGRLQIYASCDVEGVAVVSEADVQEVIRETDLSDLDGEAE
jgi:hypothetical protein